MRALAIVAVCGCGFNIQVPSGTLDAPPGTIVRRLDTAGELAGGVHDATYIHASGAIEPVAYVYGGLLASGINAKLFDHPNMGVNAGTWELLAGATVAGRGFVTPADLTYSFTTFPRALGVTRSNDYCVFFEGEIFLEVGEHRFEVNVDHDAFLELAAPGGSFARVVNSRIDPPNPDVGMFTAAAAGWHGIRAAYCQDAGDSGFDIGHQPPSGVLGALQGRRLRAVVGNLPGDDMAGFSELWLSRPDADGRGIDEATPFAESWSAAAPLRVGGRSLRIAGQLRVEAAETVAFDANAMNEHRLWIDGELASAPTAWRTGTQVPTSTSTSLALAAGWHDIAVDVSPASGAEGSITLNAEGAPLPLERLRAVPGRQRTIGGNRGTQTVSTTGGTMIINLPIAASIPGEPPPIALDIDVSYAINIDWRRTRISLQPPGGAPAIVLFDEPTTTRTGSFTDFHWLRAPASFPANQPVDGSWALLVTDTSGLGISMGMSFYSATIHYRGGPPLYPRTATYISPVIALGEPAKLVKIQSRVLDVADASVAVSARVCSDAAGTSCGVWTSASDLEAGLGERGEFAQLRVELASDGDAAAIVDWIELWAN
ncbi:MAG: hypothetical protein AB7T06_12075 [Kofleriaceae bacterium]